VSTARSSLASWQIADLQTLFVMTNLRCTDAISRPGRKRNVRVRMTLSDSVWQEVVRVEVVTVGVVPAIAVHVNW
jgi:hypothetical protein